MDQILSALSWLFYTREGVLRLVLGAVVVFLIVAVVLERRTRMMYHNHEKSESDWSLFEDDSE